MAERIWKQRIRKFFHPRPRWIWWIRSMWMVIFIIFVLFLSYGIAAPEQESSELNSPIKIYSAGKDRYATWDRDKAVDFGMQQSATAITFIFVAAAALLGYLSKTLIEPLLNTTSNVEILPTALLLFRHSAIGCCFSLFYGFIGFTYFIYVPVDDEFSAFGEIGIASNCQQLSFLAAAILMMCGISHMWNNRSQVKAKDQKGSSP